MPLLSQAAIWSQSVPEDGGGAAAAGSAVATAAPRSNSTGSRARTAEGIGPAVRPASGDDMAYFLLHAPAGSRHRARHG
ncbi:hypothetical protein O1L55_18945 [Streptomyces albulus]|nr:hypothetical protein [Streptomyces noursei]